VAGFLGHVDPGDPLDQRVGVAELQLLPLEVVGRLLAGQRGDAEQQGRHPGAAHEERPDDEVRQRRHAPGRDAGAPHELVEHHRVVRLLDDLVVEVAELGRVVALAHGVDQQPDLEDVLELPAGVQRLGDPVEADLGPPLGRLGEVPVGAAQRVEAPQLPAGVGGVDGHLGVVPGDVDEGVEVVLHRELRQPVDHGVELRFPFKGR
jgi:hypothetical protein